MGRGRKRKVTIMKPSAQSEAGAVVVEDNEGTPTSSLEPGCAVVSLRRFPAALKERIGILQARRKVAGVKDETLEMLHAYIAELGVKQLEQELDEFEQAGRDERESQP